MYKLTPWVFVSIVSACWHQQQIHTVHGGQEWTASMWRKGAGPLAFILPPWTDASFWNPPGLLPSLQRRGLSVGFIKNFFLRAKQGHTHTHTHTHTHLKRNALLCYHLPVLAGSDATVSVMLEFECPLSPTATSRAVVLEQSSFLSLTRVRIKNRIN